MALVLLAAAGAARGQVAEPDLLDIPSRGDYLDSPVFYDHYIDRYADPADLPGLRDGRVRVQHYDAFDARSFAWEQTIGTDYSWWMQMQEMRFLLPLIASPREQDRAIARDWLIRWFAVHMAGDVAPARCGEPMTWAYRALVFVYYLRSEQTRGQPDEDVVGILRGAILEHQRWLAKHFDPNSNHGFIDALGLYETTRVYDDENARGVACERLRALTRLSVSERGVHREHAAGYHFTVLGWLDEIAAYLASGPESVQETALELSDAVARMRAAAYYLQDHSGGIPQIGDTDSSAVDKFGGQYRIARAPGGQRVLVDTDAGYAVYKGDGRHRDRRYVVFRVPAQRVEMSAHAHCDALSVLYCVDGETLLGDAGKFSYAGDMRRHFCRSAMAHNTVLRALTQPDPSVVRNVLRAERVLNLSNADTTCWRGEMTNVAYHVTRTVVMSHRDRALVVTDTLRAGGQRHRPAAQPPDAVPPHAVLLWNIGPSVWKIVPLQAGEGGIWSWRLVTRRARSFEMQIRVVPLSAAATVQVRQARGEGSPMLGWYSPQHGILRPASVLVVQIEGESFVETRVDELRRHPRRRQR